MYNSKIIKKLANKKAYKLKVEGISMFPILRPGDVLILKKTTFKETKENDIVLIIKKRKPFIHRIIYKNRKYLVAKGDHNIKSDGIIKHHQIYSKVTGVIRGKEKFHLTDYYLVQSSRYFEAICQFAGKLTQNKIKYVILKGLPLHLLYEKMHPQRLYADCDFLVSPGDFPKVHEILSKLGYTQSDATLSSVQSLFDIRPKEYSYYSSHKDLPVIFDVHIEVLFLMNQLGDMSAFYPSQLQVQLNRELLTAGRKISIYGKKLVILEPEYLVLYLALHFFHHNFQGIYRLKLIDTVLSNKENKIDLILLHNLIDKFQLTSFVRTVFIMLGQYYRKTKVQFDHYKVIKLRNIRPFDGDARIESGVKRLKNIFLYSPQNFFRKISFFLSPVTILVAVWSLYKISLNRLKHE